jgi:hypothetical protein
MAKSKKVELPDVFSSSVESESETSEKSPVENLPVASGKKRRGRPRKVREAETAADAAGKQPENGSSPPADLVSTIKSAVKEAVEKNTRPTGPTSRKGIAGLVRQLTRSEVRRAVAEESGGNAPSPGLAAHVRDVLADDEVKAVASVDHGQSHPWWFLMRTR